MGHVPKIVEESSERTKETTLKDLEEHFDFNYTSDELVEVWKRLRACMLREVKRIGKDTASSQWKYFNQMRFLYAPLSSLLLIQLLVQITLS